MTSTPAVPELDDADPPVAATQPARPKRRWNHWDALALVAYCAGAVWVTSRLWGGGPDTMVRNQSDEAVSEWFLAHGAHWVAHGGNPLFSRQILLPDGANMMANTSILGLSVPLAPITLNFGAHVAFIVAMAAMFAATGYGWYHVMSRHFLRHRSAAALAGAVCGFGPAMMGHGEGQLDLTANFLLPFIVAGVLGLREPGHSVRRGVLLGALVAAQVMIVEEPLFLAGITVLLFLVFYGLQRPREVRPSLLPSLRGLAVAGVTAVILAGYPLWFQFAGPRHGSGLMAFAAESGTPLNQFVDAAPSSLGGNPTMSNDIWSRSESNTYFGWWLLGALVVLMAWQYRDAVTRSLFGAGLVVALLSCGKTITNGSWTAAGPYRFLSGVPLFDMVTPPRFGIAATCVIGVLVARSADRMRGSGREVVGWLGFVALCAVLLPLFPTPLSVIPGPAVPRFVTSGAWRAYVGPGQSVVVAPMPALHLVDGMRWGSATLTELPLARGYMLAPVGADGTPVAYNPPQRALGTLLNQAAIDGTIPVNISKMRRQAVVGDLRYWHAAIVCVAVDELNAGAVLAVGRVLFGPPTLIEGAWVWDVRAISVAGP